MRIAQLSDFHYTHLTFNPFRLFSKRFLATANWLLHRRGEFALNRLEPLRLLLQSLDVDLVLLGGDFSTSSMREEFGAMEEWVRHLHIPWIAIPGNHDMYTHRSYRKKLFYQYFSNRIPSSYSLSVEGLELCKIGPDWNIVSLDTSHPTHLASSQGLFSEFLEEKLEQCLEKIPKQEKVLLFNHYPYFSQSDPKRSLRRGKALENILRKHSNIYLYLHGHTHRHSIADLQVEGLPITIDSGSCSLSEGGSWNLIDIQPKGCSVDTYRFLESWKKMETQEFIWTR